MNDATQQGVSGSENGNTDNPELDNPTPQGNDRPQDEQLTDREQKIADIQARVDAVRDEEVKQGMVAGLQPMHEPEPEPESEPLPDEVAKDPLANYAVMHEGKPMFKTVVDGQEMLIPFERAQAQLQKHEAAEVRMAQATEYERGLKDREDRLLTAERRVDESIQNSKVTPPTGEGDQGLSDDEILSRSQGLVKDLFTGSEDQAAVKLAEILKESRGTAQVQPAIDPQEIGRQAVAAAKIELTAEQQEADIKTGYVKFVEDYPSVADDDNLFAYANGLSDQIAAAHPDWMPSQIMQEAGKQTTEWLQALKSPQPTVEDPNRDRLNRKDGLVPLPTATAPAARHESEQEETPDNSPSNALEEMRKARGQAS